jgi:CheY-like chemotaxis protein
VRDRRAAAAGGSLIVTPGRILIVEDEPVIGLALEDMLEGVGWEVVGVVSRVAQALDLLQRTAPDVAILDVNLHGETSYPVADALAERNVPYVFATGYGDAEHPERHCHAPTVTKPYSLEDVRLALSQVA